MCKTTVVVACVLIGARVLTGMQVRSPRAAKFDDRGQLIRPQGYREWVCVGTPLTPDDMNGGEAIFPEFHSVYIDRAGFEQWKQSGTFRDGTILVMERIGVGQKKAASGAGYFMGDVLGLEAAVKDSRRFADDPGHWGYFSFGDRKTAEAFPAASCNSCHRHNAGDDLVFTQYYPVLRAAKPAD